MFRTEVIPYESKVKINLKDPILAYWQTGIQRHDVFSVPPQRLKLWPNQDNRFLFLMDEGSLSTVATQFLMYVYYRPGRITV